MTMQRSSGVLLCPGRVGGAAQPRAFAGLPHPCGPATSPATRRAHGRHGPRSAPGAVSPGAWSSASSAPGRRAPRKASLRASPRVRPRVCGTISLRGWRSWALPGQRWAWSLTVGAATGPRRSRPRCRTGTSRVACLDSQPGVDPTAIPSQASGACCKTGSVPDGVFPLCLRFTSARAACSWGIKSDRSRRVTGDRFCLELRRSC